MLNDSAQGVLAVLSQGWSSALVVALAIYVSAILLKNARRFSGQLGQIPIVLALLLIPLGVIGWFVHGGDLAAILPGSGAAVPPGAWWVVTIARDGEQEVTVNLLRAGVTIAFLIIATTLLVEIGSALYARREERGLLSMHKALIKWPIVTVGCLIALKINLGAILVGTSVAVVGVGFVLKETLENLFTGMSLEVEGTVRRGDWIRHGEDTGRVYEKTWRATKIVTLTDVSITIPNRLLGIDKVHNYNLPEAPHARILTVGASYEDPPVKVKEILRSVLIRQPEVLRSPGPTVRTLSYDDFAVNYEMKFWIRDYRPHRGIEERIMTHIWYAFRFYGVQIPFPIRTVHLKDSAQLELEENSVEQAVHARLRFLKTDDSFGSLPRKDLDFLARNAFHRQYEASEHILHRGEIGDALYLVQEGYCEAVLPGGKRARIAAGGFFGEMGLLSTGPRTADVLAGSDGAGVLRVDKHCMDVLFQAHPELRARFVKVSEARREELPAGDSAHTARRDRDLGQLLRAALQTLRPW